MAYVVRLLEPAQEFVRGLDTKLKARVYWVLSLLKDTGPFLVEPYAKKIHDVKGLYELRVQSGNLACRMFYFHDTDAIYVITSGFIKKKQKTDRRELDRAIALMKQYQEERHG